MADRRTKRRLRNVNCAPMHFPDTGLVVAPGEEAEVEMPEEQATPWGFEEITKPAPAKAKE